MNALTKDLKKCVKIAEKAADGGRFLPKLHLMPPVGCQPEAGSAV